MSDQPTSGGSYIRQKNGELKLVQRTEEVDPTAAKPKTGADAADQAQQKDA